MSATGTIAWFDMPVTNMQDSMKFYSELLGWEYDPMSETYMMIRVGESHIGGLREAEGPRVEADTPVLYFHVNSLNESKEKASALGAEMIGETIDIGEDGFFQWFRDKDKNLLSFWSMSL